MTDVSISELTSLIAITSTVIMLVRTLMGDARDSQSVQEQLKTISKNVDELLKKVENFSSRITALEERMKTAFSNDERFDKELADIKRRLDEIAGR